MPFSPGDPGPVQAQFIGTVKEGRAVRIKGGHEIFSEPLWCGEQALELGLVDGLGNAVHVARDLIGTKTRHVGGSGGEVGDGGECCAGLGSWGGEGAVSAV